MGIFAHPEHFKGSLGVDVFRRFFRVKDREALFSKLRVSGGLGLYRRCRKGCPIISVDLGNVGNAACRRTQKFLIGAVGRRTHELSFLSRDAGLSRARRRLLGRLGGGRVSGSSLMCDVERLARLLRGRCRGGIVILVSRCSIPLTGTGRGNCCSRVMLLVHGLFRGKLGAGGDVGFTVLANYLEITGRDVFAKLGGFGVCSVASGDFSRAFKFASDRMERLLRCCKRRKCCSAMGS